MQQKLHEESALGKIMDSKNIRAESKCRHCIRAQYRTYKAKYFKCKQTYYMQLDANTTVGRAQEWAPVGLQTTSRTLENYPRLPLGLPSAEHRAVTLHQGSGLPAVSATMATSPQSLPQLPLDNQVVGDGMLPWPRGWASLYTQPQGGRGLTSAFQVLLIGGN